MRRGWMREKFLDWRLHFRKTWGGKLYLDGLRWVGFLCFLIRAQQSYHHGREYMVPGMRKIKIYLKKKF